MRSPSLQCALSSLAVISVLALLASFGNQLWLWECGIGRPSIAPRYAMLQPILPDEKVFGYLSDDPLSSEEGATRLLSAQYALAPRVLAYDQKLHYRYVIADLARPERLSELCRQHGLEPLASFANGVALLESTASP
jgi:hypothetical protein